MLFAVTAAYGRSCLGLDQARVSRYVIYLEPSVLGVYFGCLMLRGRATRRTALALLLGAAAVGGFRCARAIWRSYGIFMMGSWRGGIAGWPEAMSRNAIA
jgi:hypothetical protein